VPGPGGDSGGGEGGAPVGGGSSSGGNSAGGGSPIPTPLPLPVNPPRSNNGGSGSAVRPSRAFRPSRPSATDGGASGKRPTTRRPNKPNRRPTTVATKPAGKGAGRKPGRGVTSRPGVTRLTRPGGNRVPSTPRGPDMTAALSAQSAYECLLLHQYAVAKEKAQQVLASNPADAGALAVRGLALLGENRDKNFIAASSDLRSAFNQTKGQSGRAASLAALGMASLTDTTNARRREDARRFIITALDADPSLVLAATTGARFLNGIGEADRAKTVAGAAETRLSKLGGDEAAVAAFDVALCYQEIGNTAKGREFMDRFKQQMPLVAALPPLAEADNRLR